MSDNIASFKEKIMLAHANLERQWVDIKHNELNRLDREDITDEEKENTRKALEELISKANLFKEFIDGSVINRSQKEVIALGSVQCRDTPGRSGGKATPTASRDSGFVGSTNSSVIAQPVDSVHSVKDEVKQLKIGDENTSIIAQPVDSVSLQDKAKHKDDEDESTV